MKTHQYVTTKLKVCKVRLKLKIYVLIFLLKFKLFFKKAYCRPMGFDQGLKNCETAVVIRCNTKTSTYPHSAGDIQRVS